MMPSDSKQMMIVFKILSIIYLGSKKIGEGNFVYRSYYIISVIFCHKN